MRIENISYDIDGTTHIGTLAVDDTMVGKRPGVLVCHEGPGLSDVTREKARCWLRRGTSRLHSTTTEAEPSCLIAHR